MYTHSPSLDLLVYLYGSNARLGVLTEQGEWPSLLNPYMYLGWLMCISIKKEHCKVYIQHIYTELGSVYIHISKYRFFLYGGYFSLLPPRPPPSFSSLFLFFFFAFFGSYFGGPIVNRGVNHET